MRFAKERGIYAASAPEWKKLGELIAMLVQQTTSERVEEPLWKSSRRRKEANQAHAISEQSSRHATQQRNAKQTAFGVPASAGWASELSHMSKFSGLTSSSHVLPAKAVTPNLNDGK